MDHQGRLCCRPNTECTYFSTETTSLLNPVSGLSLFFFDLEPQEFVLLLLFLVISVKDILDLNKAPHTNDVHDKRPAFNGLAI
jgi:hypothetical protein